MTLPNYDAWKLASPPELEEVNIVFNRQGIHSVNWNHTYRVETYDGAVYDDASICEAYDVYFMVHTDNGGCVNIAYRDVASLHYVTLYNPAESY